MSEQFYADARLYDRLFPGGEQVVEFYRAEAETPRENRMPHRDHANAAATS
jgi:hypothetical protein